ncbi:MAG TPA: enoyl-CoA hydratase-related protein [Candidatus Binataceae bacterium]|nr:enoyl-CoA hydratase-related protein [Candidatus Binataceae bacterium]
MPDYTAILYDVRDAVATVTLNRPDAANSANETLATELLDAIIRAEENSAVRALVLTASGRFFCAGADLRSFYSQPGALKTRVSFLHVAISRIVRAPFPVIGAINGTAAGGGMGLACACDLLIAAESAKFIMAYTRRGLSPDGTTTYFLPRRIGIGRALELAYLNRTLSAREALEWGLVNRVASDAELQTEAHKLAAELAQGATRAYAAAKRLMHEGFVNTLESQIENELRSIYEMASTEDTKEAIRAFNEKRTPVFKGR